MPLHKRLTWSKFKELVDAEIDKAHTTGENVYIDTIDISYPYEPYLDFTITIENYDLYII